MGNGKALQDRIGESLHGFRNLGGCLPDSSRLVCQGLVEEGEGLLPSPPATSKIEVAHRKREVGTSGTEAFPIREQEETEEGMIMMMMLMILTMIMMMMMMMMKERRTSGGGAGAGAGGGGGRNPVCAAQVEHSHLEWNGV